MVADAPHWIELVGGANARDVGGLPTADGRQTRYGVLIRSANLQHLTAADLELLLATLDVRTVIDLRTDVEVAAEGPGPLQDEAQVTVHHLSLFPDASQAGAMGAGAVSSASARLTDEVSTTSPDEDTEKDEGGLLLPWHADDRPPAVTGIGTADLYLNYLQRRPDSVVSALRAILESPGASVVHCAAGKDRTGVVIAIALTLVGVQRAAIVADYAATEAQISAILALLARSETYHREVSDPSSIPMPRAEVMAAVLDALADRPGGLAGWLGEHGWSEADTARLRSLLVG